MSNYGFEDYDFINRLEMTEVKRVLITDHSYLKFLSYLDEERYRINYDHIQAVYLNYCSPSLTQILIIYVDGKFKREWVEDYAISGSENWTNAITPQKYFFESELKDSDRDNGI